MPGVWPPKRGVDVSRRLNESGGGRSLSGSVEESACGRKHVLFGRARELQAPRAALAVFASALDCDNDIFRYCADDKRRRTQQPAWLIVATMIV